MNHDMMIGSKKMAKPGHLYASFVIRRVVLEVLISTEEAKVKLRGGMVLLVKPVGNELLSAYNVCCTENLWKE